jgi:hypothetical protein
MLKLISLWTLNKIFDRAKIQIGGMAKMLYINCLMHHFQKLEGTLENSVAFEIFDSELDYDKYEKYFVELHKAGLVDIRQHSIYFENHWVNFIDISQLSNSIHSFKDRLINSIDLRNHILKNHKLEESQFQYFLKNFIDEQIAIGKTYNDYKDVSSHLFYWIGKRKKSPNNQKPKSNSILGM